MKLTYVKLIFELSKIVKFNGRMATGANFIKMFNEATSSDEIENIEGKCIYNKCYRSRWNIMANEGALMPKDASTLLKYYDSTFLVDEVFENIDEDVLNNFMAFLNSYGYTDVSKINVGDKTSEIYISILNENANIVVTRKRKKKIVTNKQSEVEPTDYYINITEISRILSKKSKIVMDGFRYIVVNLETFMYKLLLLFKMIFDKLLNNNLKTA